MRRSRDRSIDIFSISMLDVISGALGAFLIILIVVFPNYVNYPAVIERLQEEISTSRAALADAREAVERAELRARDAEEAARGAEGRARDAEARADRLAEASRDAAAAVGRAEAAEQRAEAAEAQAAEATARSERAEALLSKTFLVVYIRWPTRQQDVDLHVVDPSGAHFYYGRRTIPGRPGELSEDNLRGPGNEVWEIRDAPPGAYEIRVSLFSRRGNSDDPVITGRIFYRDGSTELGPLRLTREQGQLADPAAASLVARASVQEDGSVEVRTP